MVRDADELHDALTTLVALPPVPQWNEWFEALAAQRRATALSAAEFTFWVSAERLESARAIYPHSAAKPAIDAVPLANSPDDRDGAIVELLRGWFESTGPNTIHDLALRFGITPDDIMPALVRMEGEGQLLRGRFTSGPTEEWCNRRVLARIHRLTLGRLRKEIEAVSSADYMRFLHRWHHVAPATRLHGVDGTMHVIKQLQGYEIPAMAWESQILPARVAGYRREYLDQLCYSGDVMWGRLSQHQALAATEADSGRRVRPTKLAPIALFMREDAGELVAGKNEPDRGLSHAAFEVLQEIRERGAPFFADIVRGTKRLPSEVEDALWQLVAAGLVTADGFDALRALSDAKRRLGEKGERARPRSSGGRWTLLTSVAERIEPERFARLLLARWGVVFRDVIARESLAPPWRELLWSFRRLEARGEIRGGRFVAGYVGEQFALPQAIEALRAARRNYHGDDLTEVGGYDPLQLAGIITPAKPTSELLSVS